MPGRFVSRLVWLLVAGSVLSGCHDSKSPAPTTPTCTWTVTSSTVSFAAGGGSGTATIATGGSCQWSVTADSAWVSFPGGTSGVGPTTLQFTIAANNDASTRKATLTVGGQTLSVSQEGRAPCQYAVAPASFDFASAGGSGSVAVTTAAGCAWTAASPDGWVTINSGATGSGSGTVAFAVGAQSATSGRQATMTVAGQPVVVREEGAPSTPPPTNCEYSVSPVDLVEHWHGTGFTLAITTSNGCTWTAAPSESWITVDRTSGTGSASIAVSHSQFTEDATRRAAVQVRWPTVTAGQNAWVTQEGCRYGFDTTPAAVPAAGGTYRVTVVMQALSPSCAIGCPWSATSNASWIRVTTGMPMAGDDMFSYEVSANTGGARTGTITIAGRYYTVNQAGK